MRRFPVKTLLPDDLGPPLWLPDEHPLVGWAICDVCGSLRSNSVGERCAIPGYSDCPGLLRQALMRDIDPVEEGP
jgi:hypothetical protein